MNPIMVVGGVAALYFLYKKTTTSTNTTSIGTAANTAAQNAALAQSKAQTSLLTSMMNAITSLAKSGNKSSTAAGSQPSGSGAGAMINTNPIGSLFNPNTVAVEKADLSGLPVGYTNNTVVPGTDQTVSDLQALGYDNSQIFSMINQASVQSTQDSSADVNPPYSIGDIALWGQSPTGTAAPTDLIQTTPDIPAYTGDVSSEYGGSSGIDTSALIQTTPELPVYTGDNTDTSGSNNDYSYEYEDPNYSDMYYC